MNLIHHDDFKESEKQISMAETIVQMLAVQQFSHGQAINILDTAKEKLLDTPVTFCSEV